MVSRITGGDPMGSNPVQPRPPGRRAGGSRPDARPDRCRDAENWKDIIKPAGLLDSCTIDGKIYCVPVNIHSWQWLWLSNGAFETGGCRGSEELG
jgi:glucose/mannose transport system substrate-binding protein